MAAAKVDWTMGSQAGRLVDWGVAAEVGKTVGGPGPQIAALDRARMREDLSSVVPEAQDLVTELTGIAAGGFRARPWVMSRGEWVATNLTGVQRLLEPVAVRLLTDRNRSELRRKALGVQIGVLFGYVSRRVLGQYDVFLPPDDDGLLYFVGPNLAEVEQRFGLDGHEFRLWVSLHEVTHRVQFGGTAWLRGYLSGLIDAYLDTVHMDTSELLAQARRAMDDVRSGAIDWRGPNALLLLLTPQQRDLFHKMQALMSLLEGHASYVMNAAAEGRIGQLERMRWALKQRRRSGGAEKAFQRAIGLESKVVQYDVGERFVRTIVERVGWGGFNLVWRSEGDLPSLEEIGEPDRWLRRVAGV
jgi:coenzyme F420 biosynthesis associated uncharacterized protein